MKKKQLNILLIGPRLNSDRSNVGGATLSFENLISYFNEKNIVYNFIDTQRFAGIKGLIYVLYVYFKLVWKSNVVFLNVSQKGLKYLAPPIYFYTKLFGRKIITRPFGGSFKVQYQSAGVFEKWMYRNTFLKSDIMYLQTGALMDFFKPFTPNMRQLKTSRNAPSNNLLREKRPFDKRFVFIGHVKKTKGIAEILSCIKQLDSSYTLDIYGPIIDAEYRILENENYSFYKGALLGDKVLQTMSQYDVLVLPTYYEGEGYAGSIIEAYSVGLPVICTDWKALPEIVEDGKTGYLIKPKSDEDLMMKMKMFDNNNYLQMSKNALVHYSENFQVETVMSKVMTDIHQLFEKK